MHNSKGFSLLELLIVVSIILVIAAIAIPSFLAAKARADKASAINSLRVIQSAEIEYSTSNGSFTQQLNALPIPPDLQQGQKSGYTFFVHGCSRQRTFAGGCFVVVALPMRQSKYLSFRTDSMCADETGYLDSSSALNCH